MFFLKLGWSEKFLLCNFCRLAGHLCFKCVLKKEQSFQRQTNIYDNIRRSSTKQTFISIKEFVPLDCEKFQPFLYFEKPSFDFSSRTYWRTFTIFSKKSQQKIEPYRIVNM